jgi:hypothetical protein
MKIKLLLILATLGVAGGLFFLVVCLIYLLSYFSEVGNPLRHEYLQGVAIAVMLSIPFWLVASGSMYPVKNAVPRIIYLITNIVTGIVSGLFIIANTYPLIMAVIEK